MEAVDYGRPDVCPHTSPTVRTVPAEVSPRHPRLQCTRALSWPSLCEVMTVRPV